MPARTPKGDVERASRLRKARRDGAKLSDKDSRWLARYEADHPPRAARPREPAAPEPEPEPAPRVPAPEPEMVEIPAPAEAPQVPTPQGGAAPGVPAAVAPGASPQPTLHASGCTIKDCPGCAGLLNPQPQTCATTGLQVYPELSDVAARGFAWLVFVVVGVAVRMYARIAQGRMIEPIEPSPLETSELAVALKDAFRKRSSLGWVGTSFGDLAAMGGALGSFGSRQLAAPPAATLPPEGARASD